MRFRRLATFILKSIRSTHKKLSLSTEKTFRMTSLSKAILGLHPAMSGDIKIGENSFLNQKHIHKQAKPFLRNSTNSESSWMRYWQR